MAMAILSNPQILLDEPLNGLMWKDGRYEKSNFKSFTRT